MRTRPPLTLASLPRQKEDQRRKPLRWRRPSLSGVLFFILISPLMLLANTVVVHKDTVGNSDSDSDDEGPFNGSSITVIEKYHSLLSFFATSYLRNGQAVKLAKKTAEVVAEESAGKIRAIALNAREKSLPIPILISHDLDTSLELSLRMQKRSQRRSQRQTSDPRWRWLMGKTPCWLTTSTSQTKTRRASLLPHLGEVSTE